MLEALDTSTDEPFATDHVQEQPKSEPKRANKQEKVYDFPLNSSDKILNRIFDNLNVIELSRVARVCKVWQRLSDDDQQWRRFIPEAERIAVPGGKWKGFYQHKRAEFIRACSKEPGIYIRLDSDAFIAAQPGELSGEVVIHAKEDDRLLAPISLRFVGYEESYDNHSILADKVQDVETGVYAERTKWSRSAFPYEITKGLHTFPFSIRIPSIDFTDGEPLPPSIHYVWDEDIMGGSDTFAIEYLIVAKAQLHKMTNLKKSRIIMMLPSWNPTEKFSRIRFCNSETVYTSRFPFANIKFKASFQAHPNINKNFLDFEIMVEIENINTNVAGPISVTLYHSAESEEFDPPKLHAARLTHEFPMMLPKSPTGSVALKRKIEISIPQREFWINKIRGPHGAWAHCVHSISVALKISTFTTVSVSLPVEFLQDGQSNTEREQDMNRPVVELE